MKGNYQPVSILPNLSKVFERCLSNKCLHFLMKYFQNSNSVLGKDMAPNIASRITLLEKWPISVD